MKHCRTTGVTPLDTGTVLEATSIEIGSGKKSEMLFLLCVCVCMSSADLCELWPNDIEVVTFHGER